MCKHRYFIQFPPRGPPPDACPSPANASIVAHYERCPPKRNKTVGAFVGAPAGACRRVIKRHASLAEYWSDWNRAYIRASFPRLIVRYEDLLFSPYEVTHAVCGCLGGVTASRDAFSVPSDSVKAGKKGHGDGGRGRAAALLWYNDTHSSAARRDLYTEVDRAFLRDHLDLGMATALCYTRDDTTVETLGGSSSGGATRDDDDRDDPG